MKIQGFSDIGSIKMKRVHGRESRETKNEKEYQPTTQVPKCRRES
jgi:hypothetical protein